MDIAPVAPSVTSQPSRADSRRSAQTVQYAQEAAAQSAQAVATDKKAGQQPVQAAAEAPKPVVNTSGQTIGSRINVTA